MASIVPDRNRNDPNRPTSGHTPPRSNNINMGQGSGNLVPERRADKNGVISTRWVRGGSNGGGASASLSSSSVMDSAAKAPVPLNQNWENTSRTNAEHVASMVGRNAKDPDKLWDNIDFYTSMLESKHSDIALDSIADDKVIPSIRDAWLSKHGATMSDRSYTQIGGDEGYEAYREAYDGLAQAAASAETRRDQVTKDQHFADIFRGKGSAPNLDLSVDDDGRANVMVPAKEILEHEITPEEVEALQRAAFRLRYEAELPHLRERIADSASEKIDTVLEVTEALGDDLAERHDWHGEEPKGVGGSTVAWSDLNPFKRKKREPETTDEFMRKYHEGEFEPTKVDKFFLSLVSPFDKMVNSPRTDRVMDKVDDIFHLTSDDSSDKKK